LGLAVGGGTSSNVKSSTLPQSLHTMARMAAGLL
jgi:hypothetical protein